DPPIRPDPHRAHPHIQIGKRDREEAAPGKQHVASVQATHAIVYSLAGWRPRLPIAKVADQMPKGVASRSVGTQQHEVRQQDESADANAKPAVEPERLPNV